MQRGVSIQKGATIHHCIQSKSLKKFYRHNKTSAALAISREGQAKIPI